jgi:PKD repeat protein
VRPTVVVALALVFSPAAGAAPPTVSASASATTGTAPLHVVFTATGNAGSYHWSFGDGTAADGAAVEHVYGAGAFRARLTATSLAGETFTKSIRINALALTLRARKVVSYGYDLRFGGGLVPGLRGLRVGLFGPTGRRVASGLTQRSGRFRIDAPITTPGAYTARFRGTVSKTVPVTVRPTIAGRFVGPGMVGRPLRLVLRLRPAVTAPMRVDVRRDGRPLLGARYGPVATILLPSRTAGRYRVDVSTAPLPGYAPARLSLTKVVVLPRLGLGSAGPSVLALNQGLDRLHIAVGAVDSSFGLDTRDAVVAFQKLHGLPRTGAVDGRFWRYLTTAGPPRPRYPVGNHIEVSKPLQVLFVVRGGQVVFITHVSTGATGNTPVGRWHVYSKVPGWLPDGMFDSSFFLRGFAIHGYPEVPFYPGSHGCVRVPVWLAPRLYQYDPPGSTVYIY